MAKKQRKASNTRKNTTKKSKKFSLIKDRRAIFIVVAVALFGVFMLFRASAATSNFEAESSNRSSSVAVINDSAASNSKYAQFSTSEPKSSSTQRFPGDPNPLVTGKAYWGSALGGNTDPTSKYEDATGKSLSVRRTYWDMRTTGKIDKSVNSAKSDIEKNRLPFISYKLKRSWVDTANGADQAAIDDLLRRLDSLGGPIWLTIHHEPEGSATTNWADEPTGPSSWVDMQRYIRSRIDAVGTKNIAFVANMMTWTWDSRSGRNTSDWLPSDAKQIWDVYTANVYCEEGCIDDGLTPVDMDMWKNYEADMVSAGIPYGVGEWGYRWNNNSQAAADMQEVWDHGFNKGRDIVAWTYFDSDLNSPTGGWTLRDGAIDRFNKILKEDQRVMRISDLNSTSSVVSNYGTMTSTVNVPTNGTYKIWARINAPDTSNNAVNVQVDSKSIIKLGDKQITPNTWTWVDYNNGDPSNKNTISLNAGSHEVSLIGIEKGVRVDRVLITDETCIPTGTGDNCTNINPTTPPPPSAHEIDITSPSDGSSVTGKINVIASPSDNIQEVSFRLNGKWQTTDKSAPFSWNFDTTTLSDGEHTLTIRARKNGDPGNIYTEKSITVTVSNSPTTPPIPTPEPVDSESPTKPNNLSASLGFDWTKFGYAMSLKWQPSEDNVGVTSYDVSRNGQSLGQSASNGFSDTSNLQNDTLYSYSVVAKDAAGNTSKPSSITVKGSCFLVWCSLSVQ